jgi:hypothetical protein
MQWHVLIHFFKWSTIFLIGEVHGSRAGILHAPHVVTYAWHTVAADLFAYVRPGLGSHRKAT